VTRREPQLAHSHRLLQLEVAAAASFRDEQQIGKEKEVSLLGLHALKFASNFEIDERDVDSARRASRRSLSIEEGKTNLRILARAFLTRVSSFGDSI